MAFRPTLLVLVLALPLVSLACKRDPAAQARLRLDEPLAPGVARAGLIASEQELIGGVTAKGRIGDFKLYNSKVRVIVGAPEAARGFQPYGGTILDADRVRAIDQSGRSTFGEVIVALDLSVFHPRSVEVI